VSGISRPWARFSVTPGRLPVDEQLDALKQVLSRNEVLVEVLGRTASLELCGWYLTGGCVFQTVWNVVTGRSPEAGIKDYDVFHLDDGDLSWEAEDVVIRAAEKHFAGLPVQVARAARVRGQPLAIGSNASTNTVAAGLVGLFDTVVTWSDVPAGRGKPAPDIYLPAAHRLGVAPDRCLVYEDPDAGVTAALAAGMHAYHVRTGELHA
jgi:nucleotidyltransferase-like protein/haloacid dehalogenase-like hydrolase